MHNIELDLNYGRRDRPMKGIEACCCLLLVCLLSTTGSAQDQWQSADDDYGVSVGVDFRALGGAGLGFYSFSGWIPEVQLRYAINDQISAGVHFRFVQNRGELAVTRIFDSSVSTRLGMGIRRLTFSEIRIRRAIVNTKWNRPLTSSTLQHTWGMAFGLGRHLKIPSAPRLTVVVTPFYELRKVDDGHWHGSFNLDLGIHYRIRRGLKRLAP